MLLGGLGVSVHAEHTVGHLCTPGGGVAQFLVLQFTLKVSKALGCRGRLVLSCHLRSLVFPPTVMGASTSLVEPPST